MAEAVLPFKLITPTGVLFDDAVAGSDGGQSDRRIRRASAAYQLRHRPGAVRHHGQAAEDGQYRLFVVSGGLVEVKDGVMTVLASTAENAEDLSADDLLYKDVLAAEERLTHVSFYEPTYENSVRSLQLARARHRATQLRANPH